MSGNERQLRIAELLRSRERVTVEELAELCGTSSATIRRDLDVLEQRGVLRRLHGAAISLILGGVAPGYQQRALESSRVKSQLARAAVDQLKPHEFVFLDSGSTATHIAAALKTQALKVMPGSLHAAHELVAGRAEVILPGGTLIEQELALRGPLAEANIRSLRFDTAIITPCTFDLEVGIMGYDLADAAIKRAAIASARRVMVVCGQEKWHRPSPVVVSSADAINLIITDYRLSAEESVLADAARLTVTSL